MDAPNLLTASLIVQATGCKLVNAQKYELPLQRALKNYRIEQPKEIAAFLAQIAHESALFSRAEENLRYTSLPQLVRTWPTRFREAQPEERLNPIYRDGKRNPLFYVRNPPALANYVYANRMGNGDEASGNGWKFRGRGLKQLTGLSNYGAYQKATGVPVVSEPDLLALPDYAADSASWFWAIRDCKRFVARDDWDGLTQAINGGLIGQGQRMALIQQALAVLA